MQILFCARVTFDRHEHLRTREKPAADLQIRVPIVVRLEGTNVEEGRRIIENSGLSMTVVSGMEAAAKAVVEKVKI